MNVLVLGGGGREHAILWALARSPQAPRLFAAPGNPGMEPLATRLDLNPCDPEAVLAAAREHRIDLVAVGPEAPLVAGVADRLREAGIPVFGPGASGARLEGSKVFSKEFMERHGIPTSSFERCTSLPACAEALRRRTPPYVVKADGLAAGKGAFVIPTLEEALDTCRSLLEEHALGTAGATVVVEDFVEGFEITALAVTDGRTIRLLPLSQDHKRAFDGDQGPNTGGMGAYAPVPWGTDALRERILREVLEPTLEGLQEEGIPYCGVLYAGLMLAPDGSLSVLEYNVRLGDPEAQEVLPVFGGDWLEVIQRCVRGELAAIPWPEPRGHALGVVLASGGYPDAPRTGERLQGTEPFDDGTSLVFHAGTGRDEAGNLVSRGGRVLTVVGLGETLEQARERAYRRLEGIRLGGSFFRSDIGHGAHRDL